ncbi:arylesterase [Alicycliphilus denitrificans]|uniref:Arylesterase n=2 Tax=Alicycliphilus denitrificans TaxID=179636 RepID=F4G464_ALIDK|nr:Arylesterase [Alicycliphilus denitrificans K601]QKD43941.1 arylesterase [Alicycliphilus denitrificans]
MFRRDFIAAGALALLGTAPALAQQSRKAAARAPVILVVGDSLSAEYGLPRGSGWVALLEKRLAQEKIGATVVNASVSGDTTAGGRARLPALLRQHGPTHVVIELGANDALRGLPLTNTRDNLAWMVEQSQAAGARVLLVGMQMPPNYGADYARRFAALFEAVAKERKVPLVPFLLHGIADVPDSTALFQPDRIHPRAEAHPRMLDNVWPQLRKLL